MNTPICDFVRDYARKNALRLHMPGHKGANLLGMEALDITEINGADSLFEAGGIIRESEENAGRLFGCPTFYSAEGSSLCIRAMLHLAMLHARMCGKKALVLAGRNAHKVFLSAAALLDFDVEWIEPDAEGSYLSCRIDASRLEEMIIAHQPAAVYITSPDYLGNMQDISVLADVCHKYGTLLLVDCAHGAYLKFLPESRHPIDLGADMCCASAHKTLPVLTGGAYLHISPAAPEIFALQAKQALCLFGSTSPSYLILQSLDACNRYIADGYANKLASFIPLAEKLNKNLRAHGYELCGDEILKLTISAKRFGYTGYALSDMLEENGVVPEFSDPDYLVLMLTPELGTDGLERLESVLSTIPKKTEIPEKPPVYRSAERVLSICEAIFSASELLPAKDCIGRVLAAATVGCPPAVPILMCGEKIDEHALECFAYYGINELSVVR